MTLLSPDKLVVIENFPTYSEIVQKKARDLKVLLLKADQFNPTRTPHLDKNHYHIFWITRYRRKILLSGVKIYLKIKLPEIRKYSPDWEYPKIEIKSDPIHLYMVIPPI